MMRPLSPSSTGVREKQTGTLRDIVPRDLEALYELDQSCFEPGISYSRSQLRGFLRLPDREAIAFETDGRLVGFAIGCRRSAGLGSVITLDVDAEHRRRGTGTALLSTLLARLEAAGATTVALEVDVRNERAIAFYERFGFRTSRRLRDYYASGRDAFEMVRKLG